MNEEMDSNPGESDPAAVVISKGENSEGLSQLPHGFRLGLQGREKVLKLSENTWPPPGELRTRHGPSCSAPP